VGGHTSREIPCTICSKPVDLTVDLYADENGKAVHGNCYAKRVTGSWLVAGWQEWQTEQTS
jgi:hypothetical protein